MRTCPQCARQNKPRARFCDQCGHEFVGDADDAAPTRSAELQSDVDRLPPGDTAKGMPASPAGVPEEVRADKGVHRQTQKLNAPVVAPGAPTDRTSHNQETIKIARGPALPTVTGPGDAAAPQPEATIQGAFYLRKQEAGRAATAGEHVGWLVESTGSGQAPGTIWPVKAGLTPIGSSPAEVGPGVVADRKGLAPLHALVYHREGLTWLLDLGAPTGTLLNGVGLSPLQGRPLAERDELRLGALVLIFRRAEPQPASET